MGQLGSYFVDGGGKAGQPGFQRCNGPLKTSSGDVQQFGQRYTVPLAPSPSETGGKSERGAQAQDGTEGTGGGAVVVWVGRRPNDDGGGGLMGLTGLIGLFGQQRHGVGQLLQLLGGGGVGNGGGQFLLKELTNFVHGLNKQRRYRRLFFVVGGGGWTWAFQILADAVTGAGGEENFGGGKTDSGGVGHCQVVSAPVACPCF